MRLLSILSSMSCMFFLLFNISCHKHTTSSSKKENTQATGNASDQSATPAAVNEHAAPQPAATTDKSKQCRANSTFCTSKMKFSSFPQTFIVSSPAVTISNIMPTKFGCNRYGGLDLSPPIAWSGVPIGTTNLELKVIDATCAYGCAGPLGGCCQFEHWVLDIHLAKTSTYPSLFSEQSLKSGISNNPAMATFTKPNGRGNNTYFPFCPPPFQTHAFYIQAIAYQTDTTGKRVVTGKSQSVPWLLWAPDTAAANQQVTIPKPTVPTKVK